VSCIELAFFFFVQLFAAGQLLKQFHCSLPLSQNIKTLVGISPCQFTAWFALSVHCSPIFEVSSEVKTGDVTQRG
jgi:hypothetical protein